MIGVHLQADESAAAAEFFELFKTPWEPLAPDRAYDVVLCTAPPPSWAVAPLLVVFGSDHRDMDPTSASSAVPQSGGILEFGHDRLPLFGRVRTFNLPGVRPVDILARVAGGIAGIRIQRPSTTILRFGFDLFREVRHVLSEGQPAKHGATPTTDLHIDALRRWIVGAGVSVIEIPPVPWGFKFAVCLTHDIDFIGLSQHRCDHTMWGFLYRATLGSGARFLRGRIGLRVLFRCWASAVALPLVHLGWVKDFWLPFPWYLEVERNLPTTYYIIPYKHCAGQHVLADHPSRRASSYDVTDVLEWIHRLRAAGAEVGVHGIDSWHSVDRARAELGRIKDVTGATRVGVRMHWLLTGTHTPRILEAAGYDYDASVGYNERPGYRAGTTQVFRPFGNNELLELPLHVQDGALFLASRLNLTEDEAWRVCRRMIGHAAVAGGVLTILWHDRSHGPERFWGDFYRRLLGELREMPVWFATSRQAVDWFRSRRAITFHRTPAGVVARSCATPVPAFVLRVHRPDPDGSADFQWDGMADADLSRLRAKAPTPVSFAAASAT